MSIHRSDHNTIFIHIPKTAGSAMEQQDFLGGGGHRWIIDFKDQLLPRIGTKAWGRIFKWSFVRNPWDRFVSVYFKWPPTKMHADRFREFVLVDLPKVGFSRSNALNMEWPVSEMKTNKYKGLHHHFLPQYLFICENRQVMVDFVGRFERVQEDWEYVCDTVGVPRRELPMVNKGIHKPYQHYYDQETVDAIAEIYRDDIELFNYDF